LFHPNHIWKASITRFASRFSAPVRGSLHRGYWNGVHLPIYTRVAPDGRKWGQDRRGEMMTSSRLQ